MGIIRAEFEFSNTANQALSAMMANALIDTGAVHLCLPEHMAIQLDVRELE